mmetsp:Transcript_30348/g.35328  ORF Transcript_30348/g.35328 Transcript_30348/m.35328 type:complete len:491 (+) Transcript_30348:226-1698(+)
MVRGMNFAINCSSSTSSSYDETATAFTEDDDDRPASEFFKEAEDLLQRGIRNLFAAGNQCGIQIPVNANSSLAKKVKNVLNDDGDDDEGVSPKWRMDPYRSMSDWTLVVRDGSVQPQVYHIHKAVVSFGQRRSGFFVRIFEQNLRDGRSKLGKGGVTEIALPKRAAQNIPMLLDFVYEDKLDLDADSAPAMRYLANQFDVRDLYSLVSSFIQGDLSEQTVTRYIAEAEAVKDKELLTIGMQIATAKFHLIPDEALVQIPPHVFQQLISSPQMNCPTPERLSQRVAIYARGRSDEINDEVFYFMTHAQILPRICPSEALWFLNFASTKFGNVLKDESMGGYEGSLKRRCIVAASKDWKNILAGPIREEVRRKVEGGTGLSSNTDSPRRRLFVDGDVEINAEKGRGYISLPNDIRVELLEEALLNAATVGPDIGNIANNSFGPGVNGEEMASHLRHSSTPKSRQSKPEHRSDTGNRERRKGNRDRRERRQYV